MQKALTLGTALPEYPVGATKGRPAQTSAADAAETRANSTILCSVLFLDIVEFSRKPVAEQLQIKEWVTARIAAAIAGIPAEARIVLDTSEGAVINFLGNAENALSVGLALLRSLQSRTADAPEIQARIGINLGPLRLVRDVNGQPNVIGDGINVAQRVMSFARPGFVLVSRTYYEELLRLSEDYSALFSYQGSRTDKHVREHEIYEVNVTHETVLPAITARRQTQPATTAQRAAPTRKAAQRAPSASLLNNRALACGVASLSVGLLLLALAFHDVGEITQPVIPAVELKPVQSAPAFEPVPPPDLETALANTLLDSAPPAVIRPEPQSSASSRPVDPPTQSRVSTRRIVPAAPTAASTPASATPAPAASQTEAAAPDNVVSTPAPQPAVPTPSTPIPAAPQVPPVSRAKTVTGTTALVSLAVSPWGEVLVDGKRMGVSPPMMELEVEPGTHRIEIRNGDFKPYLDIVELQGNQTIRIKHKFTNAR